MSEVPETDLRVNQIGSGDRYKTDASTTPTPPSPRSHLLQTGLMRGEHLQVDAADPSLLAPTEKDAPRDRRAVGYIIGKGMAKPLAVMERVVKQNAHIAEHFNPQKPPTHVQGTPEFEAALAEWRTKDEAQAQRIVERGWVYAKAQQPQAEPETASEKKPKRIRRPRTPRAKAMAHGEKIEAAKWWSYKRDKATTDTERNKVDAAYEARLAELEVAPDYISYRRGSVMAEAPLHEIDEAGKKAQLAKFEAMREDDYRNNTKPYKRMISEKYGKVLGALLDFALEAKRVFPALNEIAKRARCSRGTVVTALQWLREHGFLDWQRRIKRVQTALGTAVRQTSNAYTLILDGVAKLTGGLFGKRTESKILSPKTETPARDPSYDMSTPLFRAQCAVQLNREGIDFGYPTTSEGRLWRQRRGVG